MRRLVIGGGLAVRSFEHSCGIVTCYVRWYSNLLSDRAAKECGIRRIESDRVAGRPKPSGLSQWSIDAQVVGLA